MSSRQQKGSMKHTIPSQIRQSHSAIAIIPYKDCCCYLKHDGARGLHDAGSGVIVTCLTSLAFPVSVLESEALHIDLLIF